MQMPRCSTCHVHLQIEDLRLKKLTPHAKWLLIYKKNWRICESLLHGSKRPDPLTPATPGLCQASHRQWSTPNKAIIASLAGDPWTAHIQLSIKHTWSPPETCMSFISVSITNSISKIDIAVDFSNIAQRDTSSWKIHGNRLQQSKHIFWWHWFFNGVHIWWSWRAAEPVIQ